MLKINVTTAEAVIQETELITAGRRGLVCSFSFSGDWDGLAKTVVVQGAVKRDVMLVEDSIVVPGECLAKENCPIRIGVYGANGEGTIVIPTIWANFGRVLPSAKRSNIPPDELTPDLVSQIQQNAANAIYLAQQVCNDAQSGKFDGYSPTVLVSSITGGHEVDITDKNGTQSFNVMDGQDGANVYYATYNSTTSADIEAAYQAGKIVCCKYGNKVYTLTYRTTTTNHTFTCVYGNVAYTVTCSSNTWTNGSRDIPAAATSAPQDLAASAAVGTSAKFAREDHKHKKPSPSDIGAYEKPGTGIPASDLASAVQTSLGLADSAMQDPGGGTTGQVLKKTADGTEWANESGGGGAEQLVVTITLDQNDDYIADKTYSEISAAITAGEIVIVEYTNNADTRQFRYAKKDTSNYFYFTDSIGNYTYSFFVTPTDHWGYSSASWPQWYTSTPKPLGTASAGSSGYASRGDHVHKMPSASDVGAIAAPVSPSSGDVLTYSSGAWAAAAPAHQIPAGGNAGECLAKNSSSDYDLRWRTINDWTPAGLMRTAGGTAAKVAEWSFWSATQYPSWLVVTVGNSNTYAGAITLKVNGSTAYPIYINGAASSATNYTLPAGSYLVYFDGTNMYFRTDGIIPGTEPKEVTISTAGAVTQALDAGKLYHFTGALTSLTITLNAAGDGQLAQYHFDFDSGSTAPTVALPGTVAMQGGTFTPEASKHYEIDILNNYGVYVAW